MKNLAFFSRNSIINLLSLVFSFLFIIALLNALFFFIHTISYLTDINEMVELKTPFSFQVYLIDSAREGLINWTQNEEASFQMISQVGKIQTRRAPGSFLAFNNFLFLLMSILALFSFKLAIRILHDVKSGAFLLAENTDRFRWIILLNVLAFIIYRVSVIFTTYYFNQKIFAEEPLSLGLNLLSFEGFGVIFWGLFLIVIAEVFRIGALVKTENDLTI